jgi:hypothetical protein
MDFTDTQCDLPFAAWAITRDGSNKGMVLEANAYPDAHELAEQGWLQRQFQPNGEMSWHWTPQAETVLNIDALMSSAEGRHN